MPIDLRELDPYAVRDPYEGDWPCRRCGYNLKGLQRGCRCPECGFAAARGGVLQTRDNLLYAPLAYLKVLQAGAMLMALGVVGSGILAAANFVDLSGTFRNPVRLGTAAAWIAGVWILTAPRQVSDRTPVNPREEWKRLRWVNRGTQACWLLGAVAAIAAARLAPITPAFRTTGPHPMEVVAELLAVIGLFGLVPLAIQIADLAEWGADTGLASRLRGSAWGLMVFGAFVHAGAYGPELLGPFAFFLLVPMLISGGLWMISLLALGYSVLQLASMTRWAIINSDHLAARDQRLLERQERDARAAEMGLYRDARGVALEREATTGACPQCGYDLTGLPPNNPCPECGNELSLIPVRRRPPAEDKPAWLLDDSPIELEPEKPRKA
jgi:predicted Zn-ribbon and HTH transcriptional regulator